MAKYEDGSYGSAAGIALIAKVLAGRCAMKYTRVAVGKGNIPDDKTPKTMTEPADYVMDAVIAGITNPVDGECQVTVQINSANVDKGFYCTAVVLYAEDPDEGEVPYTYLVLENEPEWIRPASSIVGKLATIDLIAAVGDVDTVTAAIDPEAIATVAAVNDLLQRHNEDPEAHAGIIMDAVGSAMKKLEESGQIMDQKTVETMIRKEIAEHGSGGYYGTYFLTLAASGWKQADAESPDYSYIYTAELPDSTSALIPSGAPLLGSFHIAEDAGVVNGCETGDGVVKFYSKEIPAADISTCIILFGKGGGGESDLTVATREQLGHVKIGNGIEVTEDGTISANAKVSQSDLDDALAAVLEGKADKATTLDGYGITNAYTKDEINAKISAVYKPAGSVAFAELPSLSESILGNVYNVTDAFTTTANFVEGAGNKYPKGTNVVVVKVGDAYKYDVLAGFVDLSGYVEKEAGKGLSDENFTAALKDKLDGIAAGANKYVHPTHTAAASGFYKTTVDEEGHVTATTPVTKDDITKLGIPEKDTTYGKATAAADGLMSAADKSKLDGMSIATDSEVSEMLSEVYGE